jgi:hypothetical protein
VGKTLETIDEIAERAAYAVAVASARRARVDALREVYEAIRTKPLKAREVVAKMIAAAEKEPRND